jgi:hypothetical protein
MDFILVLEAWNRFWKRSRGCTRLREWIGERVGSRRLRVLGWLTRVFGPASLRLVVPSFLVPVVLCAGILIAILADAGRQLLYDGKFQQSAEIRKAAIGDKDILQLFCQVVMRYILRVCDGQRTL